MDMPHCPAHSLSAASCVPTWQDHAPKVQISMWHVADVSHRIFLGQSAVFVRICGMIETWFRIHGASNEIIESSISCGFPVTLTVCPFTLPLGPTWYLSAFLKDYPK